MSKHEVLTGVSGIGKNDKRLFAGDVLDSADVSKKDLERFIARGAVEGHKGGVVPGFDPLADDEEGDD